MPFYMFQAQYAPSAIKAMMENPQDREAAARPLIEALGGKPGAPIVEATEYDRLYVVTVTKGRVRSEMRRYGE